MQEGEKKKNWRSSQFTYRRLWIKQKNIRDFAKKGKSQGYILANPSRYLHVHVCTCLLYPMCTSSFVCRLVPDQVTFETSSSVIQLPKQIDLFYPLTEMLHVFLFILPVRACGCPGTRSASFVKIISNSTLTQEGFSLVKTTWICN